MPCLIEISQVVLERSLIKILYMQLCFRYFAIISLEEGMTLPLYRLVHDALCHVSLKLAKWFWRDLFIKIL